MVSLGQIGTCLAQGLNALTWGCSIIWLENLHQVIGELPTSKEKKIMLFVKHSSTAITQPREIQPSLPAPFIMRPGVSKLSSSSPISLVELRSFHLIHRGVSVHITRT